MMDSLRRWRFLPTLAIWLLGGVTLLQGYLQYIRSGAEAFFGADTFSHLLRVYELREGIVQLSLGVPSFIQQLVLSLSTQLGTDPVATYSFVAILSIPLAVVCVGFLASAVFSPWVGVLASVMLGFISVQPYQTYLDGTIPNIYGSGVLIPLALLGIITACRTKSLSIRIGGITLTVLAAALLALTHHFSTLMFAVIFLAAGLATTIWLFIKGGSRRWLGIIPFGLVLFLLWFALRGTGTAVQTLAQSFVSLQNSSPWLVFLHESPRPAWGAIIYGQDLGGIVFQLGLLGMAVAIWKAFRTSEYRVALPLLVVACWALMYWLGSLSRATGEPDRLGRDFALPGGILAAYGLVWLTTKVRMYWGKPATIVTLALVVVSSVVPAYRRWNLVTDTPPYLYGAIDEEALTNAVPGKTGVYSPNFYWYAIAAARGVAITSLESQSEFETYATEENTACVVQLYYKVEIAGGQPDPLFSEPLVTERPYVVLFREDAAKSLWLSCKPIANTNQNT